MVAEKMEKMEKMEKEKLKKKATDEKKKIVKETKKAPLKEPPKEPVSDPFDVLKFVLMTERGIQGVETQNKLVFVVDRKANKPLIKRAVEEAFKFPVSKVETTIDQKGRKKAFIKFKQEGTAGEIAIRLGII